MQHFTCGIITRFIVATALLFSLTIGAPAAYYDYEAAAGLTPNAQGWSTNSWFGTASQSLSAGNLVFTDPNTLSGGHYTFTNAAINSLLADAGVPGRVTNFQARALFHIGGFGATSDVTGTETNNNQRAIFSQAVREGSGRTVGYGVSYNAGSNQFFFLDIGSSQVLSVPWNSTDYYSVLMDKPAGSPATVTLTVSNATTGVSYGSISESWGSVNGAFATFTVSSVNFGELGSGNPVGSYQLQWATFGIGEAAPFIPEPSTALLGSVGALCLWRRYRQA